MTSAKTRSNRTNARASTGPKTAAAKARTAKNALRHGLSIPVLSDPTLSDDVEALAREFAGAGASTETIERARSIAEAQIDLMRVRRGRYDLLSRALNNPNYRSEAAMKQFVRKMKTLVGLLRRLGATTPVPEIYAHLITPPPKLEGPEKLAAIMTDTLSELAALDRYERRALSRRKFAIREFDAARTAQEQRLVQLKAAC